MKRFFHIPNDAQVELKGNLPFLFLHVGCLLVFWVGVTPAAVAIAFLWLLPRMFGLTAGYHRYFSHRTYKTSRFFQFILALLGAMSIQKDPMWWAAHHRNHHRYTDTSKDAHSPRMFGFFWAHMGWVMCKKNANLVPDDLVPDLAKYPELKFLNRHQKWPVLLYVLLCALTGFAVQFGLPQWETTAGQVFVWSFFVGTIVLHHVTFLVNSAAHVWGNRAYETNEDSRNNWWVAFLTMGEGWHNNHHRYPGSERQGFFWWQVDVTHYVLQALAWFGIVWDLQKPPAEVLRQANTAKIAGVDLKAGLPENVACRSADV